MAFVNSSRAADCDCIFFESFTAFVAASSALLALVISFAVLRSESVVFSIAAVLASTAHSATDCWSSFSASATALFSVSSVFASAT